MSWIKILLIVSFLVVLATLFRHRQRVELRAGSRILALGLGALAVLSIADPGIPQRAALWVGVSRGTDLVLYALVVVFVVTTLGLYFRIHEADLRTRDLARRIAISDAVATGGLPGGGASQGGPRQDGQQGPGSLPDKD